MVTLLLNKLINLFKTIELFFQVFLQLITSRRIRRHVLIGTSSASFVIILSFLLRLLHVCTPFHIVCVHCGPSAIRCNILIRFNFLVGVGCSWSFGGRDFGESFGERLDLFLKRLRIHLTLLI